MTLSREAQQALALRNAQTTTAPNQAAEATAKPKRAEAREAMPVTVPPSAPAPLTLPPPGEQLPALITCGNCNAWKRINPRAAVGECMKWRRYSGVTLIFPDLMACSMPDPIE